jgi:hypothetical protein
LNFEKAPLKLQRAIKSPKKERKEEVREVRVVPVEKIIRGSLRFRV